MDRFRQNIFFISDLHLFHDSNRGGIITKDNTYTYNGKKILDRRPFENLDEMATQLVLNWNNTVSDNDTTFLVGDVSFGTEDMTNDILNQLNGEIILIRGNHDHLSKIKTWKKIKYFYDYKEILVEDDTVKDGFQLICMQHYPLLKWKKIRDGSIHLHGDMHFELFSTMPEYYSRKVLDVGCMGWGYKPASYKNIKDAISQRIGDGLINDKMKNIL